MRRPRGEAGSRRFAFLVDLRDGALSAHLMPPSSGLCRLSLTVRLLECVQFVIARVRLFSRRSMPHPFGQTGGSLDPALFFQPFQQPVGLGRAQLAELGDLATADRTVLFHVLLDHLLLLHRLEAALVHIRGLLAEPPVGRCAKALTSMIRCPPSHTCGVMLLLPSLLPISFVITQFASHAVATGLRGHGQSIPRPPCAAAP